MYFGASGFKSLSLKNPNPKITGKLESDGKNSAAAGDADASSFLKFVVSSHDDDAMIYLFIYFL